MIIITNLYIAMSYCINPNIEHLSKTVRKLFDEKIS